MFFSASLIATDYAKEMVSVCGLKCDNKAKQQLSHVVLPHRDLDGRTGTGTKQLSCSTALAALTSLPVAAGKTGELLAGEGPSVISEMCELKRLLD